MAKPSLLVARCEFFQSESETILTVYRASPPQRQRIAVLSAVFVLHALFLALLVRQHERAAPPLEPPSIAMISVDAERPAAAKPPPPALPAKIAKTFKPIVEVSVPAEAESTAPAGASSACATIGAVLDGLLLDPTVLVALRAAPPETRSIAGAVMMWDEGWIPAALVPNAPLWPVRANVEATLAKAPDGCLDEEIIGPRLLPIPEVGGDSTLFVVLGSGRWTWRKMISRPTALATESDVLIQEPTDRP